MARRSVSSVRGVLGPDDVERLSTHGQAERRVYYPYYWFVFRVPGRRFQCLVDARTGLVATADPFQTERCEVPENDVLDATVGEGEARTRAGRYAAHIHHRVRHWKLVEKGLLYKPFWILSFSSPSWQRHLMLVDGITGRVHPLAGSGRADVDAPA